VPFIYSNNMIGKVQQDSFHRGIPRQSDVPEPLSLGLTSGHHTVDSLGGLLRECQVGLGRPVVRQNSVSSSASSPTSPNCDSPPPPQQQQPSSRYKTEMCRPYQEHGTCRYGEKCQFAHGAHEVRCVNRHPKYKTECCRTYHRDGYCPYGPRCHFIHSLDELRSAPVSPQEKKNPGAVKQLPMLSEMMGSQRDNWSYGNNQNHHNNNNNTPKASMKTAAEQLGSYFNINSGRAPMVLSDSTDSSRSGSLCSELDNLSMASSSPPPHSSCSSPLDVSKNLRLPIFNRLA